MCGDPLELQLEVAAAIGGIQPEMPPGHLDRLRDRWKQDAEGYLKSVERGVDKMLEAALPHPLFLQ